LDANCVQYQNNIEYNCLYYFRLKVSFDLAVHVCSEEINYPIAKDIDGNVYDIVQIGNQIWMAENLKVTHYRNNDIIPNVTGNSSWVNLSSGAYYFYNNIMNSGDIYGVLYNWYAINDTKGLAPEGWHIPSDDEIMNLEIFLGMNQTQAYKTEWRGTNEGSKFADDAALWNDGALENDPEFGLSGLCYLPSGIRNSYNGGVFQFLNEANYCWSSSECESENAWYRVLGYSATEIYRGYISKKNGLSVRCIKD
jgi:uncharacterized protein (TIGR02145 family)